MVGDGETIRMCLLWMKVFITIFPSGTLVFPNFSSQKLYHVDRVIRLATKQLGHDLPISNAIRKQVENVNKGRLHP